MTLEASHIQVKSYIKITWNKALGDQAIQKAQTMFLDFGEMTTRLILLAMLILPL